MPSHESDSLRAENERLREELNGFRDGLTKMLNDAGVPATTSWPDAIQYLIDGRHLDAPLCTCHGTCSQRNVPAHLCRTKRGTL